MISGGVFEIRPDPDGGRDVVTVRCGGCLEVLGAARNEGPAVAVLRDSMDRRGALAICGACVDAILGAVRGGDPYEVENIAEVSRLARERGAQLDAHTHQGADDA